jgi:cobalt-zinc-cadmium efflux system membrane fusion protein
MARILAPVSGQVARLDARVGDAVRARQVVLLIDSREVAAAIAEHLESHRDLDLAEKTYAMTRDLFDHQAASRIALEQAASELTKARGRVARTEESLRVLGLDPSEGEQKLDPRIPVRAPLGGSVIERRVTEGQFVQPDGNALLVIADLASVWVVADVFERDLGRVHPGQRAEVATAAYPDARFIARVERLSDTVDPSSRTVKVRFLVENPSRRLKPEMFAHVTLVLGESARTLTVPARAVFSEGEASFVFVRDSGGRFSRRRVETVPDGPGRARVRSGLEMGERVVVDGALLLRLEQNKQETS